ncbi:hypothetical protein D3C79_674510 [compost metagenome]
MQALVLGQQRRVDVEQAALIVAHEAATEDAHETGQHHQVRGKAVDARHQRGIEGFTAVELGVLEHDAVDAGRRGALQAVGIGAVGNHRTDAHRAVLALAAVDQGLQVAAGARQQYHYIAGLAWHQCALRFCSSTWAAPSAASAMWPITHGCSPAARSSFRAAST